MSREVTYAKIHTNLFVPGKGDYKNTLDPQNGPDRNMKMSTSDLGLVIDTKGVEVLIPWSNVAQVVFKK